MEETGAPREIMPESGDTFTMLNLWIDLDVGGNASCVTPVEGEIFTMGIAPIGWEDVHAAPGEYVVSFIIEDLDGNAHPVNTQVMVG